MELDVLMVFLTPIFFTSETRPLLRTFASVLFM